VLGTGKVKVIPDKVDLNIMVENTEPAMKDAVRKTRDVVDQVIVLCKKYVKDTLDIRTSSIAANKDYEWVNQKEKFIGYQASQAIDVTLNDISNIEKFTEELLTIKISRISNLKFGHTKTDSIKEALNLSALENAKSNAEKMCNRMNVKLGKVVTMSNYKKTEQYDDYSESGVDMMLYRKGFGGSGFRINPEILDFESDVYVSFEIN
jgi:uncharacterized protein YggE